MTQPQRLEFSDDLLTVHWVGGVVSRFHAIWLRDNAQGASFRHPDNDQRLFDLTEFPPAITLSEATLRDGAVEVVFAPEGLHVCFDAGYLFDNAYDRAPTETRRTIWGAERAADLTRHHWDAVTGDDAAMLAWLRDIDYTGAGLLTGVPQQEGMVCKTAELFGFVRETNYGRLFEVRSEAKPTNLAFTPIGLNVHTDNPYRDPVPGLQLLHCLVNAAEGGQTILVDGFRAAKRLRAEHPAQFDLLTRYWADFRFRDTEADLATRRPIIGLDDAGQVISISYNNRSAAPLSLPFAVMSDYYAALRCFANLLHDPAGELRLNLVPGDLICFDNQRVLHGRTGFSGGARHLQGCYADKDALRSQIALLARPKLKEAAE